MIHSLDYLGQKRYNCSILSCCIWKIPQEFKVPCRMTHHPFLPTMECHYGRHLNSEGLRQIATGTHSNSVNRISYKLFEICFHFAGHRSSTQEFSARPSEYLPDLHSLCKIVLKPSNVIPLLLF